MKPLEVELLVAEMSPEGGGDRLFHLLYDGTVMDTTSYVVIGGEAEAIGVRLDENWSAGLQLREAIQVAVGALAGPDRELAPDDLEVAVLARDGERRAFRRIEGDDLGGLLG